MSRVPARIRVGDRLEIAGTEISLDAVRAGGPGGQHVNKTASKVQLRWNVVESPSLDEYQRARLLARLRPRPTALGVYLLSSERSRSQHENVADVLERFVAAVEHALAKPKPRKATKPTRAARERRLATKKRRSAVKGKRREAAE